ncbi:LysR family transcriptional regulator [Litorihabitans aurantiacus]|uniref:HTH lysR-type domain-containing protein n=1 Tax=Litorihabitans aurantiacus TaxID=1930061 RepID=A0AA38CTK9_9MICO|nr:hypothetical protein GCM10025875_28680 [Litorihabitans aurantiacus]
MDWDLPQLRALAAAVDHGSLDAAARALHVTPSAVSQRIRALEQHAGAVLIRRTRPVAPTDAGAAVLRLARQIDALARDVETDLSADGAPPASASPSTPTRSRPGCCRRWHLWPRERGSSSCAPTRTARPTSCATAA